MTCSKALNLLVFTYRNSKSFSSASSLIALYKSLVLPVLTYTSIIWTPYTVDSINKLEAIQHRLLRHLAYRFHVPMNRFDRDFSSVSKYFHIRTIKSAHDQYDTVFVFKLLMFIHTRPAINNRHFCLLCR